MNRRALAQIFCCDAVIHIRGCFAREEISPPISRIFDSGAMRFIAWRLHRIASARTLSHCLPY